MKSNRTRLLTSFALMASAFPAMCYAEDATATENAGGATAEALAAAGEAAAAETRKRAPASNFLPIVRGRLPLLFVHAIRFDEVLAKMGNKDLATKFATSVGKVFDIKKGRNFAYIGADYKPSAEDVTDAEAWAKQVGSQNAKGVAASGDAKLMTDVIEQYKAKGLATAEDVAKLSAARGAARTPKAEGAKTEGGKTAPAAGEVQTLTKGDVGNAADALLS